MQLENLNNQQTYTSRLTLVKPTFLHIIPDFNTDVTDAINSLNIGLNNCQAVYVNTKQFRVGNHVVNPKLYFHKLKERKDFELNLLQQLPNKVLDRKYIIVDHTILSKGIDQLHQFLNNKKTIIEILFERLKEEFLILKAKYPNCENVLLFNLSGSSKDGFDLIDLIQNFKLFNGDLSLFKVFDNHCLAAVSASPEHTTYIPLMGYDKKGQIELIATNIPKIQSALSLIIPKEVILDETPVPAKLEDTTIVSNAKPEDQNLSPNIGLNQTPNIKDKVLANIKAADDSIKSKLASSVVKSLVSKSEKTPDDHFYEATLSIDKSKLSKVLRSYKVTDAVVANNIKTVVDEYVRINPDELKKDDLELLILKSINYSIFNTDEIKDEYINDPNKLIAKLSEINTHFKQVSYPEPVHTPQLMSPSSMIDIHKITGPVRHEYEYGQNLDFIVESLFRSLETRKTAPIQIVDFRSELKDNNLDRVKEYTVTVKNLTGDNPTPYELKLKIPALINNRYFKLNGQSYIPVSQQYLNPITKDKPTEARFLSHYNMVTLRTVNTKFNSSQIQDILNYIKLKYPSIIENSKIDDYNNVTFIEFKNGSIVDLESEIPFKSTKHEVFIDDGIYKLRDLDIGEVLDLHLPKNEYIFNELLNLIHSIDANDQLNRTSRVNPYIQIHIMGRQLPYVIFLWQQMGLIETLTRFSVNFEIAQKPSTDKTPSIEIPLEEDKHLFLYPETKRQQLIINGLLLLPKHLAFNSRDLSNRESINEFVDSKYGSKTSFTLDLAMDNIIDPITKELLEFEDQPTNFIGITTGPLLDKLLNDTPDHPADLKNLRLRQAEVMMNLLYSELCMSFNKYSSDQKIGAKDTKLYFHPDYIIYNLLGRHAHSSGEGGSLMDYSATFSPVDELVKASKVIKTGPGGIELVPR